MKTTQQALDDFSQAWRDFVHILLRELACKTCEFRHNWPDVTLCDRCVWYDGGNDEEDQ